MRIPRSMILVGLLLTGAAACQAPASVCPEVPGQDRFLSSEELVSARASTPQPYAAPVAIELGGKHILADRVVSGPLCNEDWHGTVYVSCGVRVAEWHDSPTFLQDCTLNVEPGAVVYVAAHNNAAYYQGCSCHTGELGTP